MKRKTLKLLALLISSALVSNPLWAIDQVKIESQELKTITVDNLKFKDMDKDGKLTPYEDWRLTPAERAKDLLARMTLEEKAGMMMHGNARSLNDELGHGDKYNFCLLYTSPSPRDTR